MESPTPEPPPARERDPACAGPDLDRDQSAWWCVPQGVVEQVRQYLYHPIGVGQDRRGISNFLGPKLDALLV